MLQFGQQASEIQLGDVVDKITTLSLDPAVAYSVPVYKRILNITVNQAGNAFMLVLPHASKCPNALLSVKGTVASHASDAKVLTIRLPGTDRTEDEDDVTVTGVGDNAATADVKILLLFFSDGGNWHHVAGEVDTD